MNVMLNFTPNRLCMPRLMIDHENNIPRTIIKCSQIKVIEISSCSNQFLTHDELEFFSCLCYSHGTYYLNTVYANKDTIVVKTRGHTSDPALLSGSALDPFSGSPLASAVDSGSAPDSGSALPSGNGSAQTATKTKPMISDNR